MNTTPVPAGSTGDVLLEIADHVLLRPIDKGAYGEVWLARNMTGAFRAVKVIHRKAFSDERPFQREFEGICRFQQISPSHPGLVTILHVGQNAHAGYFYYVMELADDARTGQIIDVNSYVPKTLREELANPRRLPLPKQLEIALSLASALDYLHARNLIHRDIKPANIIFVNGLAKFADVGLMIEAGDDVSAVCTPGFMPPEGPGALTGDIFSLGKVFYELFMGLPAKRFPELPGAAEEFTAIPALLQLNNLVLKACHQDPKQRFQSAAELHKALLSVTETIHEKRPGAGTIGAGGTAHSKPGLEARSTAAIANAGKTTGPVEGQFAVTDEQRPKARWSRRAALIGLPAAIAGGGLLLMNSRKGEVDASRTATDSLVGQTSGISVVRTNKVIVLLDTNAERGVYDYGNKINGGSNATEVDKVLRENLSNSLPSRSLITHQEKINDSWKREGHVAALLPDVVIIHRSSFFHPRAAVLKEPYPPFENDKDDEKLKLWEKKYEFMGDDKLIDFLGFVGASVPHARFLVYSRGTDQRWKGLGFRQDWVKDVETRYPTLKRRITPMFIDKQPDGKDGTFRDSATQKELIRLVKPLLGLEP